MYNLFSRNGLCFGHYRFEETQEKDLVKFGIGSDGTYVFHVTSDIALDVTKKCTNTSHSLRRKAAFSFSMAAQFIYETWGEIIRLNSSYRSYAVQRKAFINILKSKKSIQKTIRRCAPPGYSEHHTGLAIDLENALDIGPRGFH